MIPSIDYIRILPELVLSITGIMIMLADPVLPGTNKRALGTIALGGILAGLMATAYPALWERLNARSRAGAWS